MADLTTWRASTKTLDLPSGLTIVLAKDNKTNIIKRGRAQPVQDALSKYGLYITYEQICEDSTIFYSAANVLWDAVVATPVRGVTIDANTILVSEMCLQDLLVIWKLFFNNTVN